MSSASSSPNNLIPANVVGNVDKYAVKGFDLRECINAKGDLEVGRLQLLLNAIAAATIPRSLADILIKAGHNIPTARITETNNAGHGRPPAKKRRVALIYRDHIAQDPVYVIDKCRRFKPVPPGRKWSAAFDSTIIVGNKQYFADGVFDNEEMEQIIVRYKIGRQPFYDAGENALGPISEAEFLRLPYNHLLYEYETRNIGADWSDVDLEFKALTAVYGLARIQADELNIRQPERWAMLRMVSATFGWFDHQPEVKLVPCNKQEMMKLYIEDKYIRGVERLIPMARTLCSFIPYFVEHSFRAYGSGFVRNKKTEFMARARKLAVSLQMEDCLGYMDEDLLFGNCLRWIGVKRPMRVLKLNPASKYVPKAFFLRAKDAPTGSAAAITTAMAVIKKIDFAHCWEPCKEFFGFRDDAILEAAEEIRRDPWKYHMHNSVYGVSPPSEDEKRIIRKAKEQVKNCAFILQAYIEAFQAGSDMANARDLKKIADADRERVDGIKGTFKRYGVIALAEARAWEIHMMSEDC